jgi:hypothetical protein
LLQIGHLSRVERQLQRQRASVPAHGYETLVAAPRVGPSIRRYARIGRVLELWQKAGESRPRAVSAKLSAVSWANGSLWLFIYFISKMPRWHNRNR